jgi:hypothetical protein
MRSAVRAASELLGRRVGVSELFDVGEETPIPATPIDREFASDAQRKALTRYSTRIDRILRGEGIMPKDFANKIGVVRQTLLRFRAGVDEPGRSTLAKMVETLRLMTGKPYLASHLYDVGDGLREL